eukprot:549042-Hanusia_phi.AAC.1
MYCRSRALGSSTPGAHAVRSGLDHPVAAASASGSETQAQLTKLTVRLTSCQPGRHQQHY